MKKTDDLTVRDADWGSAADREALRQIRYQVFVVGQQVPEDIEWTGDDGDCTHALAIDADGGAVGTGRLDRDGHIGRMAVLDSHRGRGVGRALLRHLIDRARRDGHREIHLNAQTHAMAFYAAEGFEAYGGYFMEAGIEHRSMMCKLR